MDGSVMFFPMKSRFCCALLLVVFCGSAEPPVSKAVEIWNGVVVIAGGQVVGKWVSAAPDWPDSDQWERWEQLERMSRPEEPRRLAPPTVILMPDRSGRSLLAVAAHAGIKKCGTASSKSACCRGSAARPCKPRW